MSHVFVVDTNKQPLNPITPGRARVLLTSEKAAVLKQYPFTIILKTEVREPHVHPLRIKVDPGSRVTGIAIVNDASGEVLFAAELSHRGQKIQEALASRRTMRRGRRTRHTRYRKCRCANRTRSKGWLAPSLESRVCNVLTWVKRLRHLCPIEAISMELVCFDMQAMEQADIEGCQYQQGELQGYEIREYLLAKWGRKCAYCSKEHIPLQIEHIIPRAKGGSHRVSNLTLACEKCNISKGTQDIAVFLKKNQAVLKRIQAQAKKPLKDAAAVNSTRWKLYEGLKALDLPVECGSGGLTKFNRTRRGLPKAHWIDATNVGKSTPNVLSVQSVAPLCITATGHGRRQICVTDAQAIGFPKQHKARHKTFLGYRTGDVVKAITPKRTIQGRLAIRHRPSFRIGKMDVHPKYIHRLQRADGYTYEQKGAVSLPPHR